MFESVRNLTMSYDIDYQCKICTAEDNLRDVIQLVMYIFRFILCYYENLI